MGTPAMVKQFIFKTGNSGTSKKSGKEYCMIELHDPETLENSQFFQREGKFINFTGIGFKDKVEAGFEMGVFNGRPALELSTLRKI